MDCSPDDGHAERTIGEMKTLKQVLCSCALRWTGLVSVGEHLQVCIFAWSNLAPHAGALGERFRKPSVCFIVKVSNSTYLLVGRTLCRTLACDLSQLRPGRRLRLQPRSSRQPPLNRLGSLSQKDPH